MYRNLQLQLMKAYLVITEILTNKKLKQNSKQNLWLINFLPQRSSNTRGDLAYFN